MENHSKTCVKIKGSVEYLCENCIYNNTLIGKCDYGDIESEVFQNEIKNTIENFKDTKVYSMMVDDEIPEIKFELYNYLKNENFKEDIRNLVKLIEKMDDLEVIYEFYEKEALSLSCIKIKYKEENEKDDNMVCEYLVNKMLSKDTISIWEKRGIIGVGKSFEENRTNLNDILLDVTDDIWDKVLDEATKRYMKSLPAKEEETREEIINGIVKLCEEDSDYNTTEKVCEWLVNKSKTISQYFLCVGDIQQFVDEKLKRTKLGGVFLYAETDGDNSIMDLKAWAFYEKIGQGDNFSKEELKELYEKL